MGNFFPMMVCGLFSVFWLSFGLLQFPTLDLQATYAPAGTSAADAAAAGAASVQYNAALALYLIVWGFALFTFFIFTLKTNTVFALIFLFVTIAAWVLSGAYWNVATGNYVLAGHLQKVRSLVLADEILLTLFPRRVERYYSSSVCWAGISPL
jgi:succinate-acetate transporter protein